MRQKAVDAHGIIHVHPLLFASLDFHTAVRSSLSGFLTAFFL